MALLNERFLPILFFAIFGNFRENVKKVPFLWPKTHFYFLFNEKNEILYIIDEEKKWAFGHSEFLLANVRPKAYHRTTVYERNASDSTR